MRKTENSVPIVTLNKINLNNLLKKHQNSKMDLI